MEIITIFAEHLYSIQYDDEQESEYYRLFNSWLNILDNMEFFNTYQDFLNAPFWNMCHSPEQATQRVITDAKRLKDYIKILDKNVSMGIKPDFDSHFQKLDGKYKYEWQLQPMKSYGVLTPSFLRIYAIKMAANCYLITGGGIKLGKTIQDSPLLNKELGKMDRVKAYLRQQGIFDETDL